MLSVLLCSSLHDATDWRKQTCMAWSTWRNTAVYVWLSGHRSAHRHGAFFNMCLMSGVVHSWKSWIICLTEVIFPEYQCDFRYRASPNYRYMSGTWMKVIGTEQFPFYTFFFICWKKAFKTKNEYTGNSKCKPTFIPVFTTCWKKAFKRKKWVLR